MQKLIDHILSRTIIGAIIVFWTCVILGIIAFLINILPGWLLLILFILFLCYLLGRFIIFLHSEDTGSAMP